MICPRNLSLIGLIILSLQGWSQKVYHFKYHVDIPVTTIGISSVSYAYFSAKNKAAPSQQQIQILNKEDIWSFDRRAADNWSPKACKASDILLYSSLAMPGLLFINKNVRQERKVSLIYAETMLLSVGITSLVKGLTNRYRPFVYNESANAEIKTSKDARMSFFSGHASLTATSSFFMAKVFSDLNPNSRLKPLVWTSAFVLPAAVGILRYSAGKHYPSDIIVGYITGAAIGYLVPHLHKKRESKPKQLLLY